MELKRFERAKKTYERIQAIDAEIVHFNKIGEIMAAYPSKSDWKPLFTLSVPDPRNMKQPPPLPIPDEDGFVVINGEEMPYEMAISMGLVNPNQAPTVSIYNYQKSTKDTLTYKLLAVLLTDLLEEKQMLLKRMSAYGVTPTKKVTKTILKQPKIV